MLGVAIALVLGACAPPAPPPPGIPANPVRIGSEVWRVPGGALGWVGADLLTVDQGELVRIDPEGHTHRRSLGEGPAVSSAFAVSENERFALVGRRHGDATLVDLQTGETRLLDGDDDAVVSVGFSSDGSVAVTLTTPFRGSPPRGVTRTRGASYDRALITQWHVQTGARVASWQVDSCESPGLAWVGVETFVVCDKVLHVLEKGASTVRRVKLVGPPPRRSVLASKVEATEVRARGGSLAVGNDEGFEVWSSSSTRQQQVPRRGMGALAWGPNHTLAVAIWHPTPRIEVWRGSAQIWRFAVAGGGVSELAISGDGMQLAARQGALVLRWDLVAGERLPGNDGQPWAIGAVAITEDGARVASSSIGRGVQVHEVASGRRLARWSVPPPGEITRIAIAGDRVAALGRDRLWVWEIGLDTLLFELAMGELDGLDDLDGVGGDVHAHRGGRRVRLTAGGLVDDGASPNHSLEPNWRRFPMPVTAQGAAGDWFVTGHDHGTLRRWDRTVR